MNEIRAQWKGSKAFRALLVVAIVLALLQLAAQVYFSIEPFQSAELSAGQQISADLQVYVTATQHFLQRESMYLKGSLEIQEMYYLYSPAFALMFAPILLLPQPVLVAVATILHILAYVLLYIWWMRIFRRYKLERASQLWAATLPLFLLFSAFWDDLSYLNIYIIIALFATFLIDAILEEKLGWAVFWLGVVILPIKPHWAFAAALPLILGRYKFFAKLPAGTALAYLAVMAVTIFAGGFAYGVQQYQDYIGFLARLSHDFPWRGPDRPFLGYNHSVVQTIVYFFGVSPTTFQIGTLVKLLLLVPLGIVGARYALKPEKKPGYETPQRALELAFALYLGAFLWLDMVWEVSMAMPVFVYLLATVEEKWKKAVLWVIFFPYAVIDVWRLLSYAAFGDEIMYEGSYVLSDPLTYLPVILLVLLALYWLVLEQLWRKAPSATNL